MNKGPGIPWLESAVGDLRNIRYIQGDPFLTHVTAFHAQQCRARLLNIKNLVIYFAPPTAK